MTEITNDRENKTITRDRILKKLNSNNGHEISRIAEETAIITTDETNNEKS